MNDTLSRIKRQLLRGEISYIQAGMLLLPLVDQADSSTMDMVHDTIVESIPPTKLIKAAIQGYERDGTEGWLTSAAIMMKEYENLGSFVVRANISADSEIGEYFKEFF